jgi:hypothetical protein
MFRYGRKRSRTERKDEWEEEGEIESGGKELKASRSKKRTFNPVIQ